jgi:hypothetical protein
MNRNSLRRAKILPFCSFGLASAYAFVSAIFLSLSLNIFVSVRLADRLTRGSLIAFYLSALAFFLGAVGFFVVTWNLESARSQWIAEGATPDESMLLEPIEMRKRRLYVGLVIGVVGCIAGSVLVTLKHIPLL